MLVVSRPIHDPRRKVEGRVLLDFSKATDADIAALRAGKPVVITVVDVRRDSQVRLGVTAPASVDVNRPDARRDYASERRAAAKEGGASERAA